MTKQKKILFLGEKYRADAQTWIRGLKEYGNFEIVCWELKGEGEGWKKVFRFIEFLVIGTIRVRSIVKQEKPDMVIAERTTSYGFLAARSGVHPIAIAQQGITDLFPKNSPLIPFKKKLQQIAFKRADMIHAWGPVMAEHMKSVDVDLRKVLVMPKGIDLRKFLFTSLNQKQIDPIRVIVTRSLTPVYCHNVILDAALQVKKSGVNLEWIIVGDGALRSTLESYAQKLGLTNEVKFVGRIDNQDLPKLLSTSTFYVSMPMTEGVSASLFEAMASGCYPLVTDLPGNRYWIRNDENGQLIEVNNSKMLAERLVAMVKKMNTIDLIIALNRKFIEEYASFEKNMKLISDKYHSLIEANSNA